MKRKLWLGMGILALLCMMAIPMVAQAAGETTGFEGIASYFSWETIGTFSGAVAVVVFIVQLLKLPIDRIWRIPTQYVVYIVSLVVLLLAHAFVPALGGLTWENGILCVFNAILVSLTAMSAYTVAIEKPEENKLLTELEKGTLVIDADIKNVEGQN